jgi:hypothetical protein
MVVMIGGFEVVGDHVEWVERPRTIPSETAYVSGIVGGDTIEQIKGEPLTDFIFRKADGSGKFQCAICGSSYPKSHGVQVNGKWYCTVYECADEAQAKADRSK